MHIPSNSRPLAQSFKRVLVTIFLIGLMALTLTVLIGLFPVKRINAAAAPEPTPTPSAFLPPELDKPVMPDNPLLADKGAEMYWAVCMACHGNKGQGLTEEWRRVGFGEDMNCWQSKCHAPNHPPEGFDLPRVIPPVIGPGTLKRFTIADELHRYLVATMPWWKPGSLTSEDAWGLTAFLLRENGSLPRDVEFIPKQASIAPVHLLIRSHATERIGEWILLISLGAVVIGLMVGTVLSSGHQPRSKILRRARPSFFHHLHPPTIPMLQARLRYTLGAGGLAIFLSFVLLITGILEMFFYIPTPEQAGTSIQVITFLVPFGRLVRGLHFWAAQALVVVAVIHLLRVIFTGSFALPRRFNFMLGLVLLVLTLFLDFTGYVLRWDEGIRWALTVGTNLLKTIPLIGDRVYGFVIGGEKPGLATITRFYAWHVFGLTLLMIAFVGWHIFRVRRDGGIASPVPNERTDARRITRFDLVRREVLVALLATLALILVSLLVPTPLSAPIQDTATSLITDVNAPWFFLWIQQLLRFGNAFWMGVAIPLGILIVLIILPYLFPKIPEEQKGRWFPRSGRIAQVITGIIILAVVILTILELSL